MRLVTIYQMYIFRTTQAFDAIMNKASKTHDFILASEMCVMINTLTECKSQVGEAEGLFVYINQRFSMLRLNLNISFQFM